jgi:hypothetical protein
MAIDTSEILEMALADWGEPVAIGSAGPVVIFEEPSEIISPLTGEIMTTAPQITGRVSDLGTLAQGTTVIRGGITYYVASEPKSDGQGGIFLLLSKDP